MRTNTRTNRSGWKASAIAVAVAIVPASVLAQQSDPKATATTLATAPDVGSTEGLSGYATDPDLADSTFVGPDSVQDDLARDDLDLGSLFRFPLIKGALASWYDAKRSLNDNYGLKLQLSYQALYQNASESPGEDEAAAGRAEFQGTWTLLGRNTPNAGLLSFRAEYRSLLGTDISPAQLAGQFGALGQTGTGFSDFGAALTELAWNQTVLDGRLKFGFGKISATSWYNGHILSAPKTGFQNSALQSSESRPTVGRGFGVVGAYKLADEYAVIAGIHDANGVASGNPFDTIDEADFFESVELRWYPTTFDRRKWDQVRVQLWHQDTREEAGIPSSQGVTVLASRLYDDWWMPFVFGGVSDGDASIMKADLGAGVGFGFKTAHRSARDVLGLGIAWGQPSNETQRDQYTSELFYRVQLIPHLALTPSVQMIYHPAKNPDEDTVWVVGLRARLTL